MKESRIQYCSDLHLEFQMNRLFLMKNPIQPQSDILVLAGDIVPFHLINQQKDFFSFVSDHFRMTYWVPGNHEYYHNDISKRIGTFQEKIRNNVLLLNNTTVIEDNMALIFSTLWSNIDLNHERTIQQGMNDFRIIANAEKTFTPKDCNKLFNENVQFVSEEIKIHSDKKQVVVTHHVPTFQNYPEEYLGSSMSSAFVVNLDEIIEKSKINAWIYGHHHRNIETFKIGNTLMCTNQLGHVQMNEHQGFNRAKTIII